jgi:hypothetical protein
MIESLRRHWIAVALFALVPISSCTLISEVDRGLIDEGRPDASGGTSGGGSGGSGGSSGTAGSGGTGGSNDAPTSNDDAANDATDDAQED